MDVADAASAHVVAVLVPAQVEARAGTHLEQAQRPRGLRRDRVEARRAARRTGPPRWSAGAMVSPARSQGASSRTTSSTAAQARVGVAVAAGRREDGRPARARRPSSASRCSPPKRRSAIAYSPGSSSCPARTSSTGPPASTSSAAPLHEIGIERRAQLGAGQRLRAQPADEQLLARGSRLVSRRGIARAAPAGRACRCRGGAARR